MLQHFIYLYTNAHIFLVPWITWEVFCIPFTVMLQSSVLYIHIPET